MKNQKLKRYLMVLLHMTAWLLFYLMPMIEFPLNISIKGDRAFMHLFFTLFIALAFYVNYFFLIPFFLTRRRILLYIIIAASWSVILSYSLDVILHSTSYELTDDRHRPPPELRDMQHKMPKPKPDRPEPFKGIEFFVIVTVVSIGLRMSMEWFRSEQRRVELEHDKTVAELSALKAQINPHFLFNVMNSLASLARKKSDLTETYIIKLAEMLRYNLNELSHEKVPISSEIQLIKNYIDIQNLRLVTPRKIDMQIVGPIDTVVLEPMLLFPLVENAFKHGAHGVNESEIKIYLNCQTDRFSFSVSNPVTFSAEQSKTASSAGIGLANVRRRIELLYPGKSNLQISEENNVWIATLTIESL